MDCLRLDLKGGEQRSMEDVHDRSRRRQSVTYSGKRCVEKEDGSEEIAQFKIVSGKFPWQYSNTAIEGQMLEENTYT